MALIDLFDLGGLVALASSVQQLGENCYRASYAVEKFKSNVAVVKRRHKEWQERARKFGLSYDQSLAEALHEAQKELRKEERRLENLQGSQVRRCCFKLRGTAFPLQLGESLQRFVNLDEKILSDWRAQEISDAEAQKRANELARARRFAFRRDNRYVRLPIIEKEIKDVLENRDGTSRVVLLHGPPGTGKSCMARNLALEYEATSITTTSTARSSTSIASDRGPEFEKVLYLDCGDQVDFRAKQEEMLDGLGLKREPLEPGVKPEPEVNPSGLLRQFLKERRILVVLDDVWEKAFLEGVEELCGQHVRILVTSQRSRLCDNSYLERDVISISMDRITKEIAKDILKVHSGFRTEDQVSEPIQACMDKLVEKVYMNPHALASISTAIDHRRAHQLVEWQNAINEYDDLMAAPNTSNIHGVSNPASIDKAFQIKYHRLGEQERKLMILLTMMQGPRVPESVIQLFFNEFVIPRRMGVCRSSSHFSESRKRLEDLQCVNIEETENQNLWSIHFLDKYFIQKIMESQIFSMHEKVQDLPNIVQGLESEPQVHFLKLLGALYFGGEWREHVAGDLSFSLKETKFSSLTKTAIEPIIYLMMQNVGEDWSTMHQSSADQVIISYMVHGIIHEDAAKTLLDSPIAKGTLCDVILSIVKISDISLSENLIIGMLQRFEDMEACENSFKAKLNQCRFLCDLAAAGGCENRHLLRFSLCRVKQILSVLKGNLSSGTKDDFFKLKMFSAVTVGWLALGESPSCHHDRQILLVDTPLLKGLVQCLEPKRKALELDSAAPHSRTPSNHDAHDHHANGHRRRTSYHGVGFSLHVNCESATDSEVASVGRYGGLRGAWVRGMGWQEGVGLGAERYTAGEPDGAFYSHVHHPHSMGSLVETASGWFRSKILKMGDKQFLRECAAFALACIVRGNYHTSLKVFKFPLAVTGLVEILDSADNNNDLHELRSYASQALAAMMMSISPLSEAEAKRNGLKVQEISDCLATLLAKVPDVPTDVRGHAILALASIDSERAKSFPLHTAEEFSSRGRRLVQLGYFQDGLLDLEEALHFDEKDARILSSLSFAKAKLGDWEVALRYADAAVERSDSKDAFPFQERGVLKRMMGDLPAALNDFDEFLKFDSNDYESLKQRAYVKFLMNDEIGAVADAEKALQYRPTRYHVPSYENLCLGTSTVGFLNFCL